MAVRSRQLKVSRKIPSCPGNGVKKRGGGVKDELCCLRDEERRKESAAAAGGRTIGSTLKGQSGRNYG